MNSYVNKEEVVELTQALVRCPSINPPGDTTVCANIILDKFRENNISAEIIEGKKGACNVVARLPGQNKGKTLVINGHIDVVPPGENWTVDPFGGEIRDGRIYGRGSTDMKSGVASLAAAMIAFKRSGANFDGEIIFMGAAEEETAGEFGTIYLLKNKIGTNADFAIVSEPSTMRVEVGNRGLRWIDIVVRGKASHAGRPHVGINAISYAAKLIEAINAMKFQNRNDAFEIPSPNISVTMINGGTKVNIIPERCELAVDRRMIPGETQETVIEELARVIEPIAAEEKELQIETRVNPNHFDPFLISQDEPVVQATIEAFQQVMGRKPEITAKTGCTDASHLFKMAGIPTVLFGPGNERLCHVADEYVDIENVVLSTEIFVSTFGKLLSK
ncbi:M20 family metallopeptidase [Chloroflexota bacterium]